MLLFLAILLPRFSIIEAASPVISRCRITLTRLGNVQLLSKRVDRIFIPDIHGDLFALLNTLRHAGLIDASHRWIGGKTEVYLAGDVIDGAAFGLESVFYILQLRDMARATGGSVRYNYSNHDEMIIDALTYPSKTSTKSTSLEDVSRRAFQRDWLRSRGYSIFFEILRVQLGKTIIPGFAKAFPQIDIPRQQLLAILDGFATYGPAYVGQHNNPHQKEFFSNGGFNVMLQLAQWYRSGHSFLATYHRDAELLIQSDDVLLSHGSVGPTWAELISQMGVTAIENTFETNRDSSLHANTEPPSWPYHVVALDRGMNYRLIDDANPIWLRSSVLIRSQQSVIDAIVKNLKSRDINVHISGHDPMLRQTVLKPFESREFTSIAGDVGMGFAEGNGRLAYIRISGTDGTITAVLGTNAD